ncbi:hypothetical protein MRX96_045188 [Rhipicephalus microplus]
MLGTPKGKEQECTNWLLLLLGLRSMGQDCGVRFHESDDSGWHAGLRWAYSAVYGIADRWQSFQGRWSRIEIDLRFTGRSIGARSYTASTEQRRLRRMGRDPLGGSAG